MHRLVTPLLLTLSPILFSACALSTQSLGINVNEPEPEQEACRAKISQPAIYETVTEKSSLRPQNLAHQAVRSRRPPINTKPFTVLYASDLSSGLIRPAKMK